MMITIYPKRELEAKWEEDKKLFCPAAEHPPLCLRCGRKLDGHLMDNALSRYANVMVCANYCGSDEAMRDFSGEPLPLREWYAFKTGLVQPEQPEGGVVLTPICNFKEIFNGPKKTMPFSSIPIPESKVLYSRSDYNGHKWWRTWHSCHEKPLSDELCGEVDDFSDSLMELPEFTDLSTLRRFCRMYAEPTSERTEYNMYSETASFYIWMRLIMRERDYNLYVNFFLKAS